MINEFKPLALRDSGVIYKATLYQIQKLYKDKPDLAGELAISAIELCLSESFSSNEPLIDLLLANTTELVKRNHKKYDKSVESKRQARIEEQHLDVIADLLKKKLTQHEIREYLEENYNDKITHQAVSKRVTLIRTEFPELLDQDTDSNSAENIAISSCNEEPLQPMQLLQPDVNINEKGNNNNNNVNANQSTTHSLKESSFLNDCLSDGVADSHPPVTANDLKSMNPKLLLFVGLRYCYKPFNDMDIKSFARNYDLNMNLLDDEEYMQSIINNTDTEFPSIDEINKEYAAMLDEMDNAERLKEESCKHKLLEIIKELTDNKVNEKKICQSLSKLLEKHSYRELITGIEDQIDKIARSMDTKDFSSPMAKLAYIIKCIANNVD